MTVRTERTTGSRTVDLDLVPFGGQHRPNRARIVGIAAAVGLFGSLGAVLATRSGTSDRPVPLAAAPSSSSAPAPTGDTAVADEADTTVLATMPGDGPACDAPLGSATPATLYLGGPASATNLAGPGFLFSVPPGASAAAVAASFVTQGVTGVECGVVATVDANGHTVAVVVGPPGVTTPLRLDVDVIERDGEIGVASVQGSTRYATTPAAAGGGDPTLRLLDGAPTTATTASVRFKKGDDVWELSVPPTKDDISLTVPNGETDRFPDATVDWVLVTLLDASGHVVDASGGAIG